MAAEHRRVRRAAGVLATVVVALAGGFGLLAFFVARDDAPVEERDAATTPARGPGAAAPGAGAADLPAAGRARLLRALRAGNVVLVYGPRDAPARLRALAREVAGGPYDPALESAGQAVILVRRPGTRGVVALAAGRRLAVSSAADPRLRRFAEAWLGRGANG